ncbi:hypothetical protein OTB20_32680 [Streptomyces sp. H27-H1]|uniref:hypothetical protein n=1 Tax=unclassified Streptomyces TaxID=2593676 RepID=UPI00226EA8E3|nr:MULTISPECIES: hypothetical protein [unclassified Streptomyces]MCY0930866.1 hypothetical protein [Streptomyces sp. H27-H1]MDJ0466006.1 hypothetical protein [Streptomyces sp. H27-C3]
MSAAELEGGDWIRGITVRQPWAACILAGKRTENRPANWPWRGWVLLHAGKAKPEPAVLRDPLVATAIRGRELHLGAVIGVARLTDCHLDQGPAHCTSPWAQRHAHHLVLADVHELPLPVPATGALPAWKPTQDLVDQVLQQLPHLRP